MEKTNRAHLWLRPSVPPSLSWPLPPRPMPLTNNLWPSVERGRPVNESTDSHNPGSSAIILHAWDSMSFLQLRFLLGQIGVAIGDVDIISLQYK